METCCQYQATVLEIHFRNLEYWILIFPWESSFSFSFRNDSPAYYKQMHHAANKWNMWNKLVEIHTTLRHTESPSLSFTYNPSRGWGQDRLIRSRWIETDLHLIVGEVAADTRWQIALPTINSRPSPPPPTLDGGVGPRAGRYQACSVHRPKSAV